DLEHDRPHKSGKRNRGRGNRRTEFLVRTSLGWCHCQRSAVAKKKSARMRTSKRPSKSRCTASRGVKPGGCPPWSAKRSSIARRGLKALQSIGRPGPSPDRSSHDHVRGLREVPATERAARGAGYRTGVARCWSSCAVAGDRIRGTRQPVATSL